MSTTELSDIDYLAQRLDGQIAWFSGKSAYNQTWFKRLRMVEILAAATIPFLSGHLSKDAICLPWIIGGLGVIIAVTTAVSHLYSFQEHWIRYRSTAERLTREKMLYQTRSSPYDGNDPFAALVINVETILAQENGTWAQQAGSKDDSGKGKSDGKAAEKSGG